MQEAYWLAARGRYSAKWIYVMGETSRSERRTVRFTGNVQGVGFRFTTARLAKGFAVGGYVRNLDDGSVELVVEGARRELDRFLAVVADEFQSHIDQTQAEVSPGTNEFTAFDIRH